MKDMVFIKANISRLVLTDNRILVTPIKPDEVRKSGIYAPTSVTSNDLASKTTTRRVTEVGFIRFLEVLKVSPEVKDIKVGDVVMIPAITEADIVDVVLSDLIGKQVAILDSTLHVLGIISQ